MSIFSFASGWIRGGWKTYGPGRFIGNGAYHSDEGGVSINEETSLKLMAYWACLNLRSETMACLPLGVRDPEKKIITDHPLHRLLHYSPNADMTAAEFTSLNTARTDMHGNSVNVIARGYKNRPVSLIPYAWDLCTFERNKSGSRKLWKIDGQDVDDDDILDFRGFSMNEDVGMSRLEAGRSILAAQISANNSALRTFRQGLKVGGFLIPERMLDKEKKKLIKDALAEYALPENAGKWMTLVPNMKPVAGTEFAVKPADAQLLESRLMGSVEICMLHGVPPPLIGITDKASSWATSLEQLNLHYTMYSIHPTVRRQEQKMWKKLLTVEDKAAGLEVKYNMQALMRGDAKSRREYYASALQNGYLNVDEVRDLEERGKIPGGDQYRVQVNMTSTTNTQGAEDENVK